jgi:iron complex outermembrane receptor protein
MHTKDSNPNPRSGRIRSVAVGLISLAASLSAFAQTASPPAPTGNAQDANAQPNVNTTTTTTTTTAPGGHSEGSGDQVVVLNEFTVNGSYASSLEMAAQLKQNSDAIVEVIAPEDIGVLPDVSIADDLVRLTGLTSERVNGRNQEITIRGLDPDFNVFTVDGVEQATTGDNRDAQYDQYPSELIGGATVYKTGQASLIGGIGGTVDLQFTSPLSIDHRVIAVDAFYNWTDLGQLTPGQKVAGESYSASYVDQFANGTEGVFVGYAHRETPYEGQQFQAWGYPTTGGNLILAGMKLYDQNDLLKGDSAVAVIESKPTDFIHSKLDFFLSYSNENQLLRGMEVPMDIYGPAVLQPGYTVTNGLITDFTLTRVNPVVRNMDTQIISHLASAIWNLELGEKTSWPVHFQAGWSSAKQSQEVLETYSGLYFANSETNGGDTFVVTDNAGPNPPSVVSSTNYANASLFSLTDPDGYGTYNFPASGMEGYIKYFISYDVADSYKVMTKHELDASIFKDVEVGVSYSDRYKQFGQNPTGYLLNSNGQSTAPLPPLLGTTNLSFIGNLHTVAYDPNAAVASGRYTFVPNPNPGSYEGDNYRVWEDVTRPYVQFDLKGNLGDVPFDGNIGVMADFATQSSDGFSGNGGNIVYPVSGGATYADVLPSLNLIFKPTPKDFIRLFVGRQEMRPTMYQMRSARDYGYNATDALSTITSPWSGTSGNPDIRPWLSNSADLSLEHYFGKGGGYVRVGVFEKKLLSYIYQQNTVTNFAGYPYTSAQPPVLTDGITSQYVNGQGGNISGVEADVQLSSEVLTGGAVKGFGIQLNGLLVDSKIQPWGPSNPSAPLPDMSKKTANATLYYESHGFSARVTEHYQSETREYIVQFGVPNFAGLGSPGDGYSEEIPYHTVDAQVSYAFRWGPLKGLTLYLEGRNLNDAPLITYNNGDPRQLANWQKYGASYRTGASYKF